MRLVASRSPPATGLGPVGGGELARRGEGTAGRARGVDPPAGGGSSWLVTRVPPSRPAAGAGRRPGGRPAPAGGRAEAAGVPGRKPSARCARGPWDRRGDSAWHGLAENR
ncbi:hypothetical protein SGM_6109 [Streptomyces griseoaurantiacus M045]|uniref:Uncharacterized protein n=1 Tax=Streptomyces griseoaurantiacus M045 TaxID=996637 RepID=F3NSJ5_9ACTN|nr:hypothetical protein SGM_6109 [Streptomyces griseoaurantiacus M045]